MVQDLLIEHVESLLLLVLISFAIVLIAGKGGYFRWPIWQRIAPKITFLQVFFVFIIYLGTLFVFSSAIAQILGLFAPFLVNDEFRYSPSYPALFSSFVQILSTLSAGGLLYLFCQKQRDRSSMLLIWKQSDSPDSVIEDIGYGILSWVVSFPLVSLVSEFFDFLVFLIAGPPQYEQVAVQYLKMSVNSNILLILAIFLIVIVAPIIEELLFRGFLLNFIKKYLGRSGAVVLSALAFSLFHFSFSQNLGNLPLLFSLFTLGIFLGYVYERQRSLFASLALHMTFNVINTIRIILEG